MTKESFTLKVDTSALRGALSDAAVDVLSERWRQVSSEGWTPEHDDEHDRGEMALAAAAYAGNAGTAMLDETRDIVSAHMYAKSRDLWPWDRQLWKPKSVRRDLVRAAALIIAEIERLDRKSAREVA